MEPIELSEAITTLRKELSESILAAAGEKLRFEVGQITLQFQVQVQRIKEGSGGIKFWVVDLGGKATQGSTNVHTITIPLKPVWSNGGPVLTGSSEIPQ